MIQKIMVFVAMAVSFSVGYWMRPSNTCASITLTTPFSQAGPNTVTETDPYVSPMGICADQVTGQMTMTIYPATSQTTGGGKVTAITPGTVNPVMLTLNTNTGSWYTTNGLSGKLTGASLTGAQGWLASALTSAMKDSAELWFISTGVFPGAQSYPW